MKIENKLSLNNMKKNIKRTIFTTISITLCTFLIFTTLIIISSIKNSIKEETNEQYNDYHFIIKNIRLNDLDKIKNKEYIDKIYIQENENTSLKELNEIDNLTSSNINIYIKYKNVLDTYKYSSNIIQTLGFTSQVDVSDHCSFNNNLLTLYGLMGADLTYKDNSQTNLIYRSTLNLTYIINIMIILILLVFSILFIIILYNAFLIAINERKKEYAILNSIGATEGQILKMIFFEATIMAILGIIIGGILSLLGSNLILKLLNNILSPISYNLSLNFDIKYLILALVIILLNIYISAIIPSVKASTTSVLQDIRNNKQIKYKKINRLLKKILPIEGNLALINLKRNKNKYRVITILFIICMTSYITVSTYINYEKETTSLATDYDVDAELIFDASKTDYKKILDNYITTTGDKLDYIEYKMTGLYVLVEPETALEKGSNTVQISFEDNKIGTQVSLIGLEDKIYNEYINEVHANYGDFIIYNTILNSSGNDELSYTYDTAFNTSDLKLSIISTSYNSEKDKAEYTILDDKLSGNIVLTDKLLEGFKEYRDDITIFVNMNTYNKIEERLNSYSLQYPKYTYSWFYYENNDFPIRVKVNCGNIIEFSNYMEDIVEKSNYEIPTYYYSLKNQEKIIYIDTLQLILQIVIITIIIIGAISAINTINASLCERKEEFNILYRLGATNGNTNKILIYECIYMFIKALVISIILSIPIIYAIIKHTQNIIILNKLLIPFGSICTFLALLFIISLLITLYSTKFIKNK